MDRLFVYPIAFVSVLYRSYSYNIDAIFMSVIVMVESLSEHVDWKHRCNQDVQINECMKYVLFFIR